MKEPFTLGVVGHVDHGKTALVRALTGIETDRLEEERLRGLSIVLGFAFFETDHGVVDLIDVPGHEDFIRAMIGGATAIDGIVLCVAANEGVMPQTVEHLNIARLLDFTRGCVVITKSDLADGERLAAVRREVLELTRGTFLEGAPMLDVSATSGAGIVAFRETLAGLAATPVARETHGRFFLPLDRVFTLRGFGLVVTGTLRGGELRVGDAVEVMPRGGVSSVRGLQNHNRPIDVAVPGQRVAVNLRHPKRGEIRRGDVLAAPGAIEPVRRIDTELLRLEDAVEGSIENGDQVRLLTGTTEAIARVRLLDRPELRPDETGMAQLTLDREIATRRGERILLRSSSSSRTLAGGRIIDVNAQRHRRFDAEVRHRLETAASGNLERILEQRLEGASGAGLRLGALARELGVEPMALIGVAEKLGAVRIDADLAVTRGAFETLCHEAINVLARFHRAQPLRRGLDAGRLQHAFATRTSAEVVQQVLRRCVAEGRIEHVDELLRIPGHDPIGALADTERQISGRIEQMFRTRGLEPPAPQAVIGADRSRRVALEVLLETGRLVRLRTYDRSQLIVLHADTVREAREAITRRFPYPEPFAVKDVRDLLSSTRRHVVPLMEHFDATGVTVRSGDQRRLRAP